MRILLTLAPTQETASRGENLGLSQIHASIMHNGSYDVRIFNRSGERSEEEILDLVQAFRPHFVGVAVPSHHFLGGLAGLSRKAKAKARSIVCAGGHCMMFRGEQVMNEMQSVDIVVRGEGEVTIVELLRAIQDGASLASVGGILYRDGGRTEETSPRPTEDDLDSLPQPTRIPGLEVYNISASRGCPMTCAFCSVRSFYRLLPGRQVRLRSPASVRQEVFKLKDLGAKAISFVDDNFLMSQSGALPRAKHLADIMGEAGIRWSFSCRTTELTEEVVAYCKPKGLCNVGLGLEAGTESVLGRLRKRATLQDSIAAIELCRKYDLSLIPYSMMFEPNMTVADLLASISFFRTYDLLWPSFARKELDPYPGTPIFESLESEDRVERDGYGYRALYKCSEVAEICDCVQNALRSAEDVETAIRRWEFSVDMHQEAEANGELREQVRQAFRRLSCATADYMAGVCENRPEESRYMLSIEQLREDVPAKT